MRSAISHLLRMMVQARSKPTEEPAASGEHCSKPPQQEAEDV